MSKHRTTIPRRDMEVWFYDEAGLPSEYQREAHRAWVMQGDDEAEKEAQGVLDEEARGL